MTDYNYQSVLQVFKEHENYGDKKWYKIEEWDKNSYLIRLTKDVLLDADANHLLFATPVKNSYRVESETCIYYEDLEDIEIRHFPMLEIKLSLKNIKSHMLIQCPFKWEWGYDVKSLPVYCEERCDEIFSAGNR